MSTKRTSTHEAAAVGGVGASESRDTPGMDELRAVQADLTAILDANPPMTMNLPPRSRWEIEDALPEPPDKLHPMCDVTRKGTATLRIRRDGGIVTMTIGTEVAARLIVYWRRDGDGEHVCHRVELSGGDGKELIVVEYDTGFEAFELFKGRLTTELMVHLI